MKKVDETPTPEEKTIGKIQRALEFYLSDVNLDRDKKLSDVLISDAKQTVDIEVFLKYKKMKDLKATKDLILKAAELSPYLYSPQCNSRIGRKNHHHINYNTYNWLKCTCFIGGFPKGDPFLLPCFNWIQKEIDQLLVGFDGHSLLKEVKSIRSIEKITKKESIFNGGFYVVFSHEEYLNKFQLPEKYEVDGTSGDVILMTKALYKKFKNEGIAIETAMSMVQIEHEKKDGEKVSMVQIEHEKKDGGKAEVGEIQKEILDFGIPKPLPVNTVYDEMQDIIEDNLLKNSYDNVSEREETKGFKRRKFFKYVKKRTAEGKTLNRK